MVREDLEKSAVGFLEKNGTCASASPEALSGKVVEFLLECVAQACALHLNTIITQNKIKSAKKTPQGRFLNHFFNFISPDEFPGSQSSNQLLFCWNRMDTSHPCHNILHKTFRNRMGNLLLTFHTLFAQPYI